MCRKGYGVCFADGSLKIMHILSKSVPCYEQELRVDPSPDICSIFLLGAKKDGEGKIVSFCDRA